MPGRHHGARWWMHRVAPAVVVAGAATVLAGSLLPWVVSGAATRSSYAAVRSAERLGLVPDGPWGAVVQLWYLLPAALALTTLALALERRRLLFVAGGLVVVWTTLWASATLASSVPTGVGPAVSLLGAAVLTVGLVAERPPSPPAPRH